MEGPKVVFFHVLGGANSELVSLLRVVSLVILMFNLLCVCCISCDLFMLSLFKSFHDSGQGLHFSLCLFVFLIIFNKIIVNFQ